MIATKPGIAFSYILSGGTSATGAATFNQVDQAVIPHSLESHIMLGLSLPEIALYIGIVGTIATMIFQYLNYKNNKSAKRSDVNSKK